MLRLDPGRFGFVANADDRGDAVLEQVALLDERKWEANLLCLRKQNSFEILRSSKLDGLSSLF